jgi:ATP-dependent DNA helicase RecG
MDSLMAVELSNRLSSLLDRPLPSTLPFEHPTLDELAAHVAELLGVDVPAATMMVIEGADRFGLAQLHQLRGRVGRADVESFCVLVSDTTDELAMTRLRAVVKTHDGFELAEKDFELRKEGDVLGLAQSGFPRLRVASLQVAEHRELAVRARAHVEALLDGDGRMAPPRPALTAELEDGWLRRVAAAEPATGA